MDACSDGRRIDVVDTDHMRRVVLVSAMKKVTLIRLDAETDNILISGEIVGYVENDVVYVYERNVAVRIGTVEHRSEVAALVMGWIK